MFFMFSLFAIFEWMVFWKMSNEGGAKEKSFKEIDLDSDKIITREEMKKHSMKLGGLKEKDGSSQESQELVSEVFETKGLI